MNLTPERIDEVLRGSVYGEPNVFSIHNAETDAKLNAAKVIILEGVVRELVGALEGVIHILDNNANGAPEVYLSALHQAKLIMGEE